MMKLFICCIAVEKQVVDTRDFSVAFIQDISDLSNSNISSVTSDLIDSFDISGVMQDVVSTVRDRSATIIQYENVTVLEAFDTFQNTEKIEEGILIGDPVIIDKFVEKVISIVDIKE